MKKHFFKIVLTSFLPILIVSQAMANQRCGEVLAEKFPSWSEKVMATRKTYVFSKKMEEVFGRFPRSEEALLEMYDSVESYVGSLSSIRRQNGQISEALIREIEDSPYAPSIFAILYFLPKVSDAFRNGLGGITVRHVNGESYAVSVSDKGRIELTSELWD